jgi:hypothetical protein
MGFIMTVKDGYRLIAIQQKNLLTDKIYKTAGGARAAFLRRYGENALREDVTADWSFFYEPHAGWCDKTLRGKNKISSSSPKKLQRGKMWPPRSGAKKMGGYLHKQG